MLIRRIKEEDLEGVKRNIFSLYLPDIKELEYRMNKIRESINDTHYLVAEENGEVVGIVGFRNPPQELLQFAKTEKPVELYILYVSNKKHRVGKTLLEEMLKQAEGMNYKEVIVFSANRWKESWGFYDKQGFERVGNLTPPGEGPAQVWRMEL